MAYYNLGGNTYSQLANKQSWDEMQDVTKMNSVDFPDTTDPVYGQLVEQIARNIYHYGEVTQKWRNLGATYPMNEYPGIVRELIMQDRKGQNFAMDIDPRPSTLLAYPIYKDEIAIRYHSAQFRWMYGYTLFDQELKRFTGSQKGSAIVDIHTMQQVNANNARNRFIDSLRKATFANLTANVGLTFDLGIDITDFDNLTPENAKRWLKSVDDICFELGVGTDRFVVIDDKNKYIQVGKGDLQMVIPYQWYQNVILRAFPDTYHDNYFKNLVPENIVQIDTLGGDQLIDTDGSSVLTPTFDTVGMNLLNWSTGQTTMPANPDLVCVIMHRDAMAVEENLMATYTGQMDIAKLATPVFNHYWAKSWFTDLLPVAKITK